MQKVKFPDNSIQVKPLMPDTLGNLKDILGLFKGSEYIGVDIQRTVLHDIKLGNKFIELDRVGICLYSNNGVYTDLHLNNLSKTKELSSILKQFFRSTLFVTVSYNEIVRLLLFYNVECPHLADLGLLLHRYSVYRKLDSQILEFIDLPSSLSLDTFYSYANLCCAIYNFFSDTVPDSLNLLQLTEGLLLLSDYNNFSIRLGLSDTYTSVISDLQSKIDTIVKQCKERYGIYIKDKDEVTAYINNKLHISTQKLSVDKISTYFLEMQDLVNDHDKYLEYSSKLAGFEFPCVRNKYSIYQSSLYNYRNIPVINKDLLKYINLPSDVSYIEITQRDTKDINFSILVILKGLLCARLSKSLSDQFKVVGILNNGHSKSVLITIDNQSVASSIRPFIENFISSLSKNKQFAVDYRQYNLKEIKNKC